ncbi:UNVERIFIED_CONTAM: hypothetical protein Sangu_2738900 [Sesamum angustifolium]|uniref:Uncharacterized protein n=1 Tax=Sesamum angustifolium TaxID=2727405 RepID=A0AAW2IY01_9LAMI
MPIQSYENGGLSNFDSSSCFLPFVHHIPSQTALHRCAAAKKKAAAVSKKASHNRESPPARCLSSPVSPGLIQALRPAHVTSLGPSSGSRCLLG